VVLGWCMGILLASRMPSAVRGSESASLLVQLFPVTLSSNKRACADRRLCPVSARTDGGRRFLLRFNAM
jgi:hypothetical protein